MFGDRLAVVQDDANFVALVGLADGRVDSIALPASDGGVRQFDDLRGNKRLKLDLEASVIDVEGGRATLFAFGSGSSPARARLSAVLDHDEPGTPSQLCVMTATEKSACASITCAVPAVVTLIGYTPGWCSE